MSSLWPSTIASLNDSLAVLYGSVAKLQAAKSVDMAEVTEQLKTATESSRNLRDLILSEMPGATWKNREELDVVLEEIQKLIEARNLEQRRSRLLDLVAEFERGTIVHRRTARVTQLNELRDQAIKELRSEAALQGGPQSLPGPDSDEWIEWACALKEPQDAEYLKAIRDGFPHLDEFVANLEPNMWTIKKEILA